METNGANLVLCSTTNSYHVNVSFLPHLVTFPFIMVWEHLESTRLTHLPHTSISIAGNAEFTSCLERKLVESFHPLAHLLDNIRLHGPAPNNCEQCTLLFQSPGTPALSFFHWMRWSLAKWLSWLHAKQLASVVITWTPWLCVGPTAIVIGIGYTELSFNIALVWARRCEKFILSIQGKACISCLIWLSSLLIKVTLTWSYHQMVQKVSVGLPGRHQKTPQGPSGTLQNVHTLHRNWCQKPLTMHPLLNRNYALPSCWYIANAPPVRCMRITCSVFFILDR